MTTAPATTPPAKRGVPARSGLNIDYQEYALFGVVILLVIAGWISPREERKQAGDKLRQLNTVPDNPDRITRELSGGNQQKVVLARWLLRECRVLLLDEPTRGVDVGAKAEIYRLIAELSASGIGIVVVSSEMEELMGLSSRILIMREGELVAEVDGETATEVELLSHAVAPTDTDVVLE
jgi:ribose transport system ATP-binding protein